MTQFARIGTFGMIALVALRVGIGWHFFMEGTDKIKSGSFSSEGFLKASEGRLADQFHRLVWDYDGSLRLDAQLVKGQFEQAAEQARQRFGLTEAQLPKLERLKKQALEKVDQVYAEHSQAIFKYREGAPRKERMEQSAMWREVSSLREQKNRIERERLAAVWPAVESIDAIWQQYELNLNRDLPTNEQRASAAYLYVERPGEGVLSSRTLDRIIPIFDVTVGVLLIIGLFVPLAGWMGALFLAGVVLSQFPGDPNTQLTYFQSVEALALIALATIGAGRFAGLDFLTWAWRQNRKAARLQAA